MSKIQNDKGNKPEKAKKVGRPEKLDTERVTKLLPIHVTQNEFKQVNEAHKLVSAGRRISRNAYLKELIMASGAVKQSVGYSKLAPQKTQLLLLIRMDLSSLYSDLRGISKNYNQVVKRINSQENNHKLLKELALLKEQHDQIIEMTQHLYKSLEQLSDL